METHFHVRREVQRRDRDFLRLPLPADLQRGPAKNVGIVDRPEDRVIRSTKHVIDLGVQLPGDLLAVSREQVLSLCHGNFVAVQDAAGIGCELPAQRGALRILGDESEDHFVSLQKVIRVNRYARFDHYKVRARVRDPKTAARCLFYGREAGCPLCQRELSLCQACHIVLERLIVIVRRRKTGRSAHPLQLPGAAPTRRWSRPGQISREPGDSLKRSGPTGSRGAGRRRGRQRSPREGRRTDHRTA